MTCPTRAFALLGGALTLLGCGSDDLTAVRDDGDQIPLRIVTDLRQPDSTQTPATIETASISGDTLHLALSYAGGCGDHEFGLAASSSVTESDPPQVTVILRHDGHNDTCRALVRHSITADLRNLQRLAGDHRTVRVQLFGPWGLTPFETVLVYDF